MRAPAGIKDSPESETITLPLLPKDPEYNFLDEPLKEAINNLPHDPEVIEYKKKYESVHPNLKQFAKYLKQLGKKAGLQGPVVYYPFGGFDSHHAFLLVKNATDVISFGKDSFAFANASFALSPENTLNYVRNADSRTKYGSHYFGYDRTKYYYECIEEALALLALARIVNFLDGQITGLYYFKLKEDGDIEFVSKNDRNADTGNAVITFRDTYTGIEKRYWYIQHIQRNEHDIFANKPNFYNLIRKVKFQTLLIKAAYANWGEDDPIFMNNIHREILIPAKNNKAKVFTDNKDLDTNKPYPI